MKNEAREGRLWDKKNAGRCYCISRRMQSTRRHDIYIYIYGRRPLSPTNTGLIYKLWIRPATVHCALIFFLAFLRFTFARCTSFSFLEINRIKIFFIKIDPINSSSIVKYLSKTDFSLFAFPSRIYKNSNTMHGEFQQHVYSLLWRRRSPPLNRQFPSRSLILYIDTDLINLYRFTR